MASNLPPPPVCINLVQINTERVEICHRVPPPGDSIPIETDPFAIGDSIPSMDNIEWEVRRLRHH